MPLAGAAGWPEAARALAERGTRLGLAPDSVAHLGTSYGTLATEVLDLVSANAALAERLYADLPAIRAEVVYAAERELAMTVTDALERRMRVALEAGDHGMSAAADTAALLGAVLGWNARQQSEAITAFGTYVRRHDAGLCEPETEAVD